LITNNIIDGVSTTDTTGNGTAQAIYLEAGPDGVQIIANRFNNIHSNRSAKGVLIGDAGSTNPSVNDQIDGNSITNVTSDARGAYGVQINNGNGSMLNTGLQITHNTISGLTGTTGWVHAIGLEANTPGVNVANNTISNLSGPSGAVNAVWFENEDTSFATGTVNSNNLDVTVANFGIQVHPALSGGSVDGTCNWWGSPSGPTTPTNPGGAGSKVSANVDYTPWLLSSAPFGTCAGGSATRKDCDKAVDQNKKAFDDQQHADDKAFDDNQKADKKAFDASHPSPQDRKAFDDQQKADRKVFDDKQKADKKAFDEQNHADKEQCKSLPK